MRDPDFDGFTEQFAGRRFLGRKVAIEFRSDRDRPRLYCDEPAIVARFSAQMAQLARQHSKSEISILMRGQSDHYDGMVPSLFRTLASSVMSSSLLQAETLFEKEVAQINFERFKRPHLAALLQHYGYRTAWLDVVDNLWVAVWFATHILEGVGQRKWTRQRHGGSGWLYLIAARASLKDPCAIDLRREHHGLSLRPHTQSGWSIRGPNGLEHDLRASVIGCIEFPINERWSISGHMGSSGFLFPAKQLDDTLRRLVENDVDHIAGSIESRLHLPPQTLGRVYLVQDTASSRSDDHP